MNARIAMNGARNLANTRQGYRTVKTAAIRQGNARSSTRSGGSGLGQ
jgi:hypothetical protein